MSFLTHGLGRLRLVLGGFVLGDHLFEWDAKAILREGLFEVIQLLSLVSAERMA